MTTRDIQKILSGISKNDIVEMGEDSDGNDVFAIKMGSSYSTLTIGNIDPSDLDAE